MALEEFGYEITDKDANTEWLATDYQIQVRSPSGGGTFAKDNSQATIVYLVEYNYHERFIDVVLGKTVLSGGALKRSAATPDFDTSNGSLPEEHPYYFNFFAATAEVVPAGTAHQDEIVGPLWDKALITVVFRPVTYNVLSDEELAGGAEYKRFTTKTNEGSADFQTSQGQFRFVTDPVHRPLEIQPGIVVAAQKMSYTWHQIPVGSGPNLGQVPNIDTIMPLLGKVNSVTIDGYPPGTILFSGYTPKLVLPQAATSGNYYWDITYSFGYRNYGASGSEGGFNIGWNYAYDPTRHLWDLYTVDGTSTGRTQYTYADLNTLFQVTW